MSIILLYILLGVLWWLNAYFFMGARESTKNFPLKAKLEIAGRTIIMWPMIFAHYANQWFNNKNKK